jgi:hypothetical protein
MGTDIDPRFATGRELIYDAPDDASWRQSPPVRYDAWNQAR